MLRGSHLATVDEKGRVKVPADFLDELRRYGKQFYVTSENGDYARIYPDESVGRDRREARETLLAQSDQAEISDADELLTVKWSSLTGRDAC